MKKEKRRKRKRERKREKRKKERKKEERERERKRKRKRKRGTFTESGINNTKWGEGFSSRREGACLPHQSGGGKQGSCPLCTEKKHNLWERKKKDKMTKKKKKKKRELRKKGKRELLKWSLSDPLHNKNNPTKNAKHSLTFFNA